MLERGQVDRLIADAASAALSRVGIMRVYSAPTVDSASKPALNVTIVLTREASTRITGDEAIDAMVQIGRILEKSGDDRFPIIEFATEEELERSGDPES